MEPPVVDANAPGPIDPVQPPKTSIPTTIGLLNIIFGSLMLVCIACSVVYIGIQIAVSPMVMAMQEQQLQVVIKAERQKKLQQLEEQEKGAQDEKEKADLRAKQKALEDQPLPKFPDFMRVLRNGHVQTLMAVDYISGFLLNVVMVVSGIGLLRLKEWGRQTGIWIAIAKIVRLVAIYTVFSLMTVPIAVKDFTDMMQEFIDEMAKAGQAGGRGPGPAEMAQVGTVLGVVYTAIAIGMIIIGSVYPFIVLITLTQARVKAACNPSPEMIPISPSSEGITQLDPKKSPTSEGITEIGPG